MLPIIFAGVGAAGAVAGGVSTAVKSAKDVETADKIQAELGNGSGINLNPYEGQGLKEAIKAFVAKTGIEEEGKKAMKKILTNLSDSIDIQPTEGSGLILHPYKNN